MAAINKMPVRIGKCFCGAGDAVGAQPHDHPGRCWYPAEHEGGDITLMCFTEDHWRKRESSD